MSFLVESHAIRYILDAYAMHMGYTFYIDIVRLTVVYRTCISVVCYL